MAQPCLPFFPINSIMLAIFLLIYYRSQGQQNKSKNNGNFEGFSGNLTLGIPAMVNAR